jgi:hypothetical protein
MRDNLFNFLEAMHEYGIPRDKLFLESDLIEEKNPFRVCDCLEELAKVSKSKSMLFIDIYP